MKRFYYKRVLAVIMVITVVTVISSFSAADVKIPDTVRIGLFYSDPSSGVKGAVSTFNVSAVLGLQIGYSANNSFCVLLEEPSGNNITIRKDAYYSNKNNTLSECSAQDAAVQDGSKIGPFHVQIGQGYPDYTSVSQKINELQQSGIAAYPAFIDNWYVWTGFYTDQNTAQADLKNNIQAKLGDGIYNMVQPAANRIVASKSTGETALIFGSDSYFLQIHPKQENSPYMLKVNKSLYRGDLEIRRLKDSDMTVVNILPLEEYLYGVVPSEMPSGSGPEALKAQAVAARTYTLATMGKHSKYAFDLCTTDNCQVYKGYSGEAKSTNKAVDDTKSRILVYNGRPAQIYYFSSSGGRTEDIKNVWSSEVPYLKSVDDPYESGNSYKYNWEVNITPAQVKSIVGSKLGDITSITVTKTSEAGRPIEVVIQGTKDKRVYLKGACRTIFSGTDYALYSQWYTISTNDGVSVGNGVSSPKKMQLGDKKVMTSSGLKDIKGSNNNITVIGADGQKNTVSMAPASFKFTGKGWGHGVGMSQEGARGFADHGYTYDQILMHYFVGTTIQ